MAAEQRVDGPTPSGGAYAVAIFSRDGKPAEKADATAVEIAEYAADGAELLRTYGGSDRLAAAPGMTASSVWDALGEATEAYLDAFGEMPPFTELRRDTAAALEAIRAALAAGRPYQSSVPAGADI